MSGLPPRLIAYGFIGAFGLIGPLFLLIALNAAVHRAVFIHTAQRAEGKVIDMQPTQTTRHWAGMYIPLVRYTAEDGRVYVLISDTPVRPSSLSLGEQVTVLYQQGHPETARIDAFSPLWTFSLIFGIVGAAFTSFPALILVNVIRQRQLLRTAY
jgi:hypothetical protein